MAMDRAEAELGVQSTVVQAADPATWEGTLGRLAEQGNRVVVAAFPETAAAVTAAAGAHPGTRFVHLDGDIGAPDVPNLETIAFDAWQGWYLAGILAGEASVTRQVGYIGEAADDAHHAAANAFTAASTDRDPDVVVQADLVATPGDAAGGADLAVEQLGLGADILAADAGAADPAIVATAAQAGAFAIAGSEAFAAAMPETVIGTVAVLRGQALLEALRSALGPTPTAGTRRAGIADGLVELIVNEAFLDAGPDEMRARVAPAVDLVNTARDAIIAGGLVPARDIRPPA
jgi:basic membrane lipoprotein Med (substrate-binding protein (PBP1-ABC) superfamily)